MNHRRPKPLSLERVIFEANRNTSWVLRIGRWATLLFRRGNLGKHKPVSRVIGTQTTVSIPAVKALENGAYPGGFV